MPCGGTLSFYGYSICTHSLVLQTFFDMNEEYMLVHKWYVH